MPFITEKTWKWIFYSLIFLNLFFLSAVISYQITIQGEMAKIPDLTGLTLDEAKETAVEKKFSVIQSGSQIDQKWEKGKIIFQEPPPESKIKLFKGVKVILSAGKEKVEVPSLVGKNFQPIGKYLEEFWLRKGKVSHVHTSKYSAGRIIAQSPLPGDEVPRDSYISLLVSQGAKEKRYLMPDLLGKKADRVTRWLREMEFRVGDIRQVYYPGLESGIIIKQFPPQGYRVQKRNLITLEVSK
ncbi:MAG: PASTA domain-containing protein [Acidobacteriota bacterium]